MSPYRQLLALWILAITLGAVAIMGHRVSSYAPYMIRVGCYRLGLLDSDTIGYAAVRKFSANHLIVDGDFRRVELPESLFIPSPNVTGSYLIRGVAKGAIVHERDVRPTPVVAPRRGLTVVSVSVGSEAVRSGVIEACTPVWISVGHDLFHGVVEAVMGVEKDKSYTALVSVTPEAAIKIASRGTAPLVVSRMPLSAKKGDQMDQKAWSELNTYKVEPKKTPWVLAIDFVMPGTLLKLATPDDTQTWTYNSQGAKCGPDGDSKATPGDGLPMPTAPIGCLIAKLGGSTSPVGSTGDGTVFAVGSFCIRKVADSDGGPLYLGMNVAPSKLPDTPGSINVHVYESKQ